MENKSHLTALSRNKLSAPMRWLVDQGLIAAKNNPLRTLDYGCGRGYDADQLGMHKYDPHYFPGGTGFNWCDLVTCNYVLNVVPNPDDRLDILEDIKLSINQKGVAFVSVRNDKRSLNGWTSKNTWQGFIEDDEFESCGFEKIYTCPEFRMFRYTKRRA